MARNTAAPTRRTALDRTSTTDSPSAREPITTGCPAASRLTAVSRADRSVAMSASQKPTNGARVASRPARTAMPLPGRSQRSSRTGTGCRGQRRTTSPVPSVLALSTTTMAAGSGSAAAFWHSAASPSGSLRASLRAGTTISSAGASFGPTARSPRRTRQRVSVLVERGIARRAVRGTGFSTFSTTATAPTAITMPTTMAMIRRDTGRSSSGARWLDISGRQGN